MRELLLKVEQEIQNRNILPEEISSILSSIPEIKDRRIVGGYASFSIVDREGHRITIPALKEAVARFMSEEYYKSVNIFHSDVVCGRILNKWTNPETGEIIRTQVDDKGWYVVAELRANIEVADKVWEEIIKGNIKSFSIAGSSKDKKEVHEGGKTFLDVNALDLYEVTLCEIPVNPMSTFSVLYDPNKVEI